jgi:hypothetical protein
VAASLARVWENVLDWEHLPWLHRDTFAAIRLEHADRSGWRAVANMQEGAEPLLIDVAIDRSAGRYHTRTVDGPGAGTDIVTTLTAGADGTAIEVVFLVPGVPPAAAPRVGAYYRALYAKLWDEDEAMMTRRQAVLDGTLAPVCREVRVDGRSHRFVPVCPHLGGPLEQAPIDGGCVACPWHGYRFEVRTGRSADGRGLVLRSG